MQNYQLELVSEASNSFRAIKAAQSMDIDVEKKLKHVFNVSADVESNFNIGLILGASGSGKTTLAKHIWGNDCFKTMLNPDKTLIDQFPEHFTYDECSQALGGAGLASVVTWIRPAKTLSNGQQARAEMALQLASDKEFIIIDEFTSVVDRTVAKAMAHTIQKVARKLGKKIILLSCHYDVIEWLNPCWVIDCNKQEYIDRRAFFLTTNASKASPSMCVNANEMLGSILASIII